MPRRLADADPERDAAPFMDEPPLNGRLPRSALRQGPDKENRIELAQIPEVEHLTRAVALLGPLEGRVMRTVWSRQVAASFVVRDMRRLMPELAYTTVMTTLNRLAQKGLLRSEPVTGHRAHAYSLALPPSEFIREASSRVVADIVRRYGDMALAAFTIHLERLTPEERRHLGGLTAP